MYNLNLKNTSWKVIRKGSPQYHQSKQKNKNLKSTYKFYVKILFQSIFYMNKKQLISTSDNCIHKCYVVLTYNICYNI